MHAGVRAQVDEGDGRARQIERGALDDRGVAEQGQNRAVMVGIAMDVDELRADGDDRALEGGDDALVTSLADVRNTREQLSASPPSLSRPWLP
jgi:hypothetical protein